KEGGNISQNQQYLLTNLYKSKISYGIENNASSMHGLRCAGSCSPHHCGGVLLACIPHPVEWQCSPSQNHRTSDNCLCEASPACVLLCLFGQMLHVLISGCCPCSAVCHGAFGVEKEAGIAKDCVSHFTACYPQFSFVPILGCRIPPPV